jgi:hypothetical protein
LSQAPPSRLAALVTWIFFAQKLRDLLRTLQPPKDIATLGAIEVLFVWNRLVITPRRWL